MSGEGRGRDITTELVHAGERRAGQRGVPVSTPVYTAATYTYETMEEFDRVFAGEDPGHVYSRYGNPTTGALEEALRTLEGGAAACSYASGMAALHAALLACDLTPGSAVLASQDLYGATSQLLYTVFGAFGVKTLTADFSNPDEMREKALGARPRALVAETISNPLLKVCDIEACADVAREAGARLVVDNTFASPYLCRPLGHGADFVVHSATKYLGGHADVVGGLVVARDAADQASLVGVMKLVGGVLGVWEAHEVLRGLKTLAVRLDRQCENARRLAERLAAHPRVARVYYPGLADAPSAREVLGRMLRAPHGGALVTLRLADDTREATFRFMDALDLCVRSTSLGDVFTSVLHPATASHREVAPARRRALGITDGLVRVSVGIEAFEDIAADIEQGLGR